MGLTNVLAPLPARTRLGAVDAPRSDDLVFDVLLGEDENLPNKVTEYPIEDGSSVSDNVIPMSDTFTVQGAISNAPLYDVLDVLGNVAQGKPVNGVLVGQNVNRAQLAWQKLKALRNGRKLLRIVTPRETFLNYAITNLGRTKNVTTGEVLSFTVACKRVNTVPVQFVTKLKATRSGQQQPNLDKANQSPADAPAAAKIQASALKHLTDGLGVTTPGSGLIPGGGGFH